MRLRRRRATGSRSARRAAVAALHLVRRFLAQSRRQSACLPVASTAMSASASSSLSASPRTPSSASCGWQRRGCAATRRPDRPAARNLHVTLAFLGHRPAGELDAIVGALARGRRRCRRDPSSRSGATARRAASGCSSSTTRTGAATALAGELHERLEALGVYERESAPWLPHVTVAALPRAAAAPAAAAGSRRGQSVRSGCLPFRAAPGRGAVRTFSKLVASRSRGG